MTVSHIIKTETSPYSPMQMFELVADFERYPEFLPFCTHASSKPAGQDKVNGTLFINKGPFRKSFTTHNTMWRKTTPARIDIQLVNGPFKTLYGEWRFARHADDLGGCLITLDLHYDMKSGLLNNALSSAFEWMAKTMVDAFCQQAHQLYGTTVDHSINPANKS